MIFCPKCNQGNAKKNDLNFTDKVVDGKPARKMDELKYEFACKTVECAHVWCPSPEGEKLYAEYVVLLKETNFATPTFTRGDAYNPTSVDFDKILERVGIARKLFEEYRYDVDFDPKDWQQMQVDTCKISELK